MKHDHGDGSTSCTEIGSTVCLRETVHGGSPDITTPDGSMAGGPEQHLWGFIIAHDVEGQKVRCSGGLAVDPHAVADGHEVWTMTGSLAGGDLTLNPSVQCTTHPEFHANVVNGKWTG